MAESSPTYNSGGIGLGGLLFAIFLTLKILAIEPVAGWSWWWVTAPLWISFLLFLFVVAIGFLFLAAFAALKR